MVRFLLPFARVSVVGVLFLGLCILSGCSKSSDSGKGNVEGKVKVDGTLANSGNVAFTVSGVTITGSIGADGTYRAVGVPVGDAQVTVTSATGPAGMSGMKAPPAVEGTPGGTVSNPVAIPAKYGKAESSGLKHTVKSGTNSFDIDLTK